MTMTFGSPPPVAPAANPPIPVVDLQLMVRGDDACAVTWRKTAGPERCAVVTRPGGGAIGSIDLQLNVTIPLLNFGGVVIPDCGRHYVNSPKALDIRAEQFQVTAANAGHPFFAVNDEAGRFLLAVGLLNAPGAVAIRRLLPRISKRRAMVGGDEHLAIAMQWTWHEPDAHSADIGVFVSENAGHWFDALRCYADLIRRREELVYPRHAGAWEPVWCTWTAFPSAHMTSERVLANAEAAKKLGMGAVILDDGWFGPGLDDDGPRPINHGDYDADATKFADLPALVKQVQALGLRMLLWHAPLCVAPTSNAAASLRHWFMHDDKGEFLSVNGLYQLCPACPQVRDYVRAETRRLLTRFGADGLKVDLFNCLSPQPCRNPDHHHDIADPVQALDAVMAAQWEAARDVNPDVLLELKQDYGNVRLVRHGTMVRAGDTAYDMATNLQRCGYTQAFAECVHVDPLVTSVHTRPEALALLMVKALSGGVPTFSMDLARLSAPQQEVIAAWLGFYNGHRALFQTRRNPQGRVLDVWQGGGPRQWWLAAVGQATEINLPGGEVVFLLNGTDRESFYLPCGAEQEVLLRYFDHRLQPLGEQQATLYPGGVLPAVPGGLVEIRRP